MASFFPENRYLGAKVLQSVWSELLAFRGWISICDAIQQSPSP